MKLFYRPGVCSLAPHIALTEAGVDFQIEAVNKEKMETETGENYLNINERGSVPYLLLEKGLGLSEASAILQYIADLKPEKNLAPANGTMERYQLQEWLNYIATEVHKTHFPLFYKETGEAAYAFYMKKLEKAYSYLSESLEGQEFIFGNTFTVADAYLFTVINWHRALKKDLSPWPALVAYHKRIGSRPSVQKAMEAEGILTPANS